MNLSALLGCRLKDDDVLEILEAYRIDHVTYDFDRNHENMEDRYWAAANSAGFLLRFNQAQILDTIFCYIAPSEGFSTISRQIIGSPIYDSFDDAEAACKHARLKYSVSNAAKGQEFHKLWLRVEAPECGVHYQFKGGALSLVTLMLLLK